MPRKLPLHNMAAYGGKGWSPRLQSLPEEIGTVWSRFGLTNEWGCLKAVLLHRPGRELAASKNPDDVQMLQSLDSNRAQHQHDNLARAFIKAGVSVYFVEPGVDNQPNQMFVADLMFMTSEGAILARPASTVRAGEERWVARRLTDIGIPILRSVRGNGVFEGADAAWLNPGMVILGKGFRTNAEGAAQVAAVLKELGAEVFVTDLPRGSMHLMGILRFADHDLAIAWPGRLAPSAVDVIKANGYDLHFIPDTREATAGFALNFVTLGPRKILMPADNPITQGFFESLGITCFTVKLSELVKAAGAVGCLTGIIERELPE